MTTENTIKETILQEAQRLVFGARTEAYGHPLDNFTMISHLWNTWLGARYKGQTFSLDAKDVGVMMTLLKIAREGNKEGRDNLVDAAGYLGCVERVLEEEKRRADRRQTELPPHVGGSTIVEKRESSGDHSLPARGDAEPCGCGICDGGPR